MHCISAAMSPVSSMEDWTAKVMDSSYGERNTGRVDDGKRDSISNCILEFVVTDWALPKFVLCDVPPPGTSR